MTSITELVDTPQHAPPASLAEGFAVRPWAEALVGLGDSWDGLARQAATPNPFFERWYLEPSLRLCAPPDRVLLATLVEGGRLVALMPILRSGNYHGRRLPHVTTWLHPNSFCGEPLTAPGCADRFARALLDWCDSAARTELFLHLPCLPEDGALRAALARIDGPARRVATVQRFARAALRPGLAPQDHLAAAMERKRRKELGRKRRRLEEEGALVFTRHADAPGLDRWIDDFLALERAGWKGAEGSALASAPATAGLFRHALEGAATRGRLERLAFHLDGRPIAMLANFITPPHSFAFKTAFDESLSKLSPGMLLQVENLALLEREDIILSDSCAVPGHPMIEQIWSDRRSITMTSVAIGGRLRRRIGAALFAIERRREENRQ